jgi:hypothetical protein
MIDLGNEVQFPYDSREEHHCDDEQDHQHGDKDVKTSLRPVVVPQGLESVPVRVAFFDAYTGIKIVISGHGMNSSRVIVGGTP